MLLLLTSPFAGTTLQFSSPSHDQTPSKSGSSSSILNIAPPTKLQSSTMTAHLSSFTSTKLTSQLTSKPQIPPMVTPPSTSTNAMAPHTSSGLELSTTAVSSVSRYVAPLLLCFFDFGLTFFFSSARRSGKTSAGTFTGLPYIFSRNCPCGTTIIQTRAHIFCECPLFADHRHILCKASAQLDLSVLLGTTPNSLRHLKPFRNTTRAS